MDWTTGLNYWTVLEGHNNLAGLVFRLRNSPPPLPLPPSHPPPSLSFSLLNVQGSGEVELVDDRTLLLNQQAGQAEMDLQTEYQLTTASYTERRAEDMVALEVSGE